MKVDPMWTFDLGIPRRNRKGRVSISSDAPPAGLEPATLRVPEHPRPGTANPPYAGFSPQAAGPRHATNGSIRPRKWTEFGPLIKVSERRYDGLSWPAYLGAFLSLALVALIVWWVA